MTVRFSRGGGGYGGYSESLAVEDDGSFTMDRRYSGRRAGHFAGSLAADDHDRLQRAVDAARAAAQPEAEAEAEVDVPADPNAPPPAITPESSADVIDLGDAGQSFGAWDEPDGAWGELLVLLRALMESLLDQPVYALELEVGRDSPSLVLRHAGAEPVRLAGSPIDAQATLMDQQSRTLGSWRAQVDVPAGDVGDGWQLDLGLTADAFDMQPGTGYLASAAVAVVVGGAEHTWTLHGTGGEGWDE